MKCEYCGSEIDVHDLYCSSCGSKNPNYSPAYEKISRDLDDPEDIDKTFNFTKDTTPHPQPLVNNPNNRTQKDLKYDKDAKTLSILGIVFACLGFNIVSVILSVVALSNASKSSTKKYKTLAIIALIVSVALTVLYSILSATTNIFKMFKS
ncbi:MAG: CD225/dispanin family protein [Clostridia bacterium]|nr:CD225/dispanin family protein [Clostridia bacterium]